MRVAVEFTRVRSPYFKWAIHLCRKLPSYRMRVDDDLELHSVRFTEHEFPLFEALFRLVGGWTGCMFAINGQPAGKWDAFVRVRDAWRKAHPKEDQAQFEAFFTSDRTQAQLLGMRPTGQKQRRLE